MASPAPPAEALLGGEPEAAGAAVRGEPTTRATPRAVPDGARGHEQRCLVRDHVAYPADESVAEIRGV
ncbi:hypothetical protein A6A08_02640 [Nocardiopsis sp. TSRI0078]|nr:hypothetical protein A6A08_02640 [Nocardiopsis sp. TSRI0078]